MQAIRRASVDFLRRPAVNSELKRLSACHRVKKTPQSGLQLRLADRRLSWADTDIALQLLWLPAPTVGGR